MTLSSTSPDEIRIEARNLTKRYPGDRGVFDLDMQAARGECLVILGRNGSGKSTLLRLLLGLEKADSGLLKIMGKDCSSRPPSMKSIGAVVDTSVHWEDLTGKQNAGFVAKAYGMTGRDSRLTDLFEATDLSEQAEDTVGVYSFGMRRKLNFVQALCSDPQLLIADEPTIGVDPQFLIRLTSFIKDRNTRGNTTVLASSDPLWCSGVGTRVLFMEDGKISAEGSVEDLVREAAEKQEIHITLKNYADMPDPKKVGVLSFSQKGNTVVAVTDPKPKHISELVSHVLASGGDIASMTIKRGDLSDAFFMKTGKVIQE